MSLNRYHPRKWWRGWLCLLRALIAGPLCAMGRPWTEWILLVFVVFALCGCASFTPQPVDQVGVLARATTKEDGQVRVTVAVPSPEESAALFGIDVAGEGIQPVRLRIENHDDVDYFFLPISLDPHYFSSQEAALLFSVCLAAYGHRAGVGAATRATPRFNYTGDSYHTDGKRVVLVISTQEVPWHALVEIDWGDVTPQSP